VILPFVEEVAMSGSITGAKRRRDPEPARIVTRAPEQPLDFHGGTTALASALSKGADLRRIHVVGGDLSEALAEEIIKVVEGSSKLQHLKIGLCSADCDSLVAIAGALARTASLQSFAITHFSAVKGWAGALAKALAVNTSLVDLQIEGTIVQAAGAAALAKAAGRHQKLSHVTLAAMNFAPLAKFLTGLSTLDTGGLEKLTLCRLKENITSPCLDALCKMVQGERVKTLEMNTALAPRAVDRLLAALEGEARSTVLELGAGLVLSDEQARRLRLQQPPATVQPSIEIQQQVQQALQRCSTPIAPAISPVAVMPVTSAPEDRHVGNLSEWRECAEAHLKRGDLDLFEQAMARGQLAPLTYELKDLKFLTGALNRVAALERVHLIGVPVSPTDAQCFGAALLKHRSLKKLGLTHCRYQTQAFEAMTEALASYGGLEALKIGADPSDQVDKQRMQTAVCSLVARNPGLRNLTLAGAWIDAPEFFEALLPGLRKTEHFTNLKLVSCPAGLFDGLMENLHKQVPWRLPQLTLQGVSGDLNHCSFDEIVQKLASCPVDKLVIKARTLSTVGTQKLITLMMQDCSYQTLVEFEAMNHLAVLADERRSLQTANSIVAFRIQQSRNPKPPLQF
jgi:hypothetical protein